jgi:UDP-N-acetylglucosamine 4-epimerase
VAKSFDDSRDVLRRDPRKWLITGVAGFIGSHLLEALLSLGQKVVGLDNFLTGSKSNLQAVRQNISPEHWSRFELIEGDIRNAADCRRSCEGVDVVLHQAALCSVPRSIADPVLSTDINVMGTVNVLRAANEAGIRRFIFASSSSVYGDEPNLPKVEDRIGRQLSPYAVAKRVNEIHAEQFALHYGMEYVGLRYFNVFGPRQSPDGPYAAVIPRWIQAMCVGKSVTINGTGETSRDFCFVTNVVQANILAAMTPNTDAVNTIYNVALNQRTSLNGLFEMLREGLSSSFPHLKDCTPEYVPFRAGDILHSQADTSKAHTRLGYEPTHMVKQGIDDTLSWYGAKALS